MDEMLNFLKENLVLVIVAAAAIVFAVFLVIYLLRNTKKVHEKRDKRESSKFNKHLEQVEKRLYKKCRNCGENVPVEDRICQSCNQMPD